MNRPINSPELDAITTIIRRLYDNCAIFVNFFTIQTLGRTDRIKLIASLHYKELGFIHINFVGLVRRANPSIFHYYATTKIVKY